MFPPSASSVQPAGATGTPAKACIPAVADLVEHLRRTGTGESKLAKLTELGCICHDLDSFLEMAANNVPAATMAKVDAYIGRHTEASAHTDEALSAKDKKKAKTIREHWSGTKRGEEIAARQKEAAQRQEEGKSSEGGSHTEVRSTTQSSVPDHTVLVESRAPVLKEGNKPPQKLGAEVKVPEGESPDDAVDEGDQGEEEETSEVSDMNADEAKDAISRMRSTDKLQHIAENDKRKTVQEAAQKRLDELKNGGE